MRAMVVLLALLTLGGCATQPPAGQPTQGQTTAGPASPTAGSIGREVTFPAADGAPLRGRLYGGGPTFVVLANMSDNDPVPWDRFGGTVAGPGIAVLTFAYRYPTRPRSFTSANADEAVLDLTGAIAFARQQGPIRLVLIGASLGGMAVAKTAAAARADAVVIIGAPNRRIEFDLQVTDRDIAAITAPKLFIVSEDDPNVPPAQTRPLFEAAAEPKRWQAYPGRAHGTDLLDGADANGVRRLLTEFITAG